MIIDGTNLILGRLAAYAAKKSLLGEKVFIVNSENVMVSGKKNMVFANYKRKYDMGSTLIGPFFPKHPHLIVKRTIRGMLPYKMNKGRIAHKNIRCYIGVPNELVGKKFETIPEANVSRISHNRYVSISEISKFLGARF